MERPAVFMIGFVTLIVGITFRLAVVDIFHSFKWGSDVLISTDYRIMQAWQDIFVAMIYAGIALALIGWFYPKTPLPSAHDSTQHAHEAA